MPLLLHDQEKYITRYLSPLLRFKSSPFSLHRLWQNLQVYSLYSGAERTLGNGYAGQRESLRYGQSQAEASR